ncbi:unnamed protein product [Periconia digitata]|uniref:Mediator of RNA polymerase II transcription subunit 8 n=1 Tax=Periconia digitata TaxID=1303443 RepID=A0A9W4XMB7_9PLEO|nr:unnamed protein product [Periconia digitata]
MNSNPSTAPGAPATSTLGRLSGADAAALVSLRSKLMPLVYQLEVMKQEMASSPQPPDWPSIQRSTATVTHLLTSLHTLLHSSSPQTTHLFASLHVYPVSPYPVNDAQPLSVLDTHLRKMPQPHDAAWVEKRVGKAAGFMRVPEEWGVDAPAPSPSDDEGDDGKEEGKVRVKGMLSEDEIARLWRDAPAIVEDEMANVGSEDGSPADEDEDEDEDEEMGGVDDGAKGKSGGGSSSVVAQTLMPLESLHRFMMSGGAVDG